ncbi:MAG: hypothetical protein ACLUOI_12845 [Eisenbergiella sp.]
MALKGMHENTTKIRNIKQYLLRCCIILSTR